MSLRMDSCKIFKKGLLASLASERAFLALRARKPQWKEGDWHQLFNDYYASFLVKETFSNLCKNHSNVSFLNLTKVRVFDILWWSFLKSKRAR